MSTRKIIIGLPAFNEEIAIGKVLSKIHALPQINGYEKEVLIYNDGSKDKTVEVANKWKDRLKITVIGEETNRGLGVALNGIVQHALRNGKDDDILVVFDCDDTHDPSQIQSMVEKNEEGYEIVIASRFKKGSVISGVPIHRKLFTYAAVALFKIIYPINNVRDFTCGYRTYRISILSKALETYGEYLIRSSGFSCMAELLLKLNRIGGRATEVPLILRYDLKPTESKMDVSNTALNTLSLLIKWRLKGIENC